MQMKSTCESGTPELPPRLVAPPSQGRYPGPLGPLDEAGRREEMRQVGGMLPSGAEGEFGRCVSVTGF